MKTWSTTLDTDTMNTMSKSFIRLAACCLAASAIIACNDDGGVTPVSLDPASLKAEPAPGKIILRWNIPADADYRLVRVCYQLPDRSCMRTASVYADSMVVDNLLARYGDIDFSFTTVSADGTESTPPLHVTARAEAAPKTIKLGEETGKVPIDGAHVWGDRGEVSEGPIEDLVDGNNNSFYHTIWSGRMWVYQDNGSGGYNKVAAGGGTELPYYIVMDCQKQIQAFSFYYKCRNNANKSNPEEMTVLGSDTFSPVLFDEEAYGAFEIKSFKGLSGDQAAEYTSAPLVAEKPFRYIWFKFTKITYNKTFLALAELSIDAYGVSIYDPEAAD